MGRRADSRYPLSGINLAWTDTPGEREMQAVKLGKGESWPAEAESRMPWGRLIQPEGRRPPNVVLAERRFDSDDGRAYRPIAKQRSRLPRIGIS